MKKQIDYSGVDSIIELCKFGNIICKPFINELNDLDVEDNCVIVDNKYIFNIDDNRWKVINHDTLYHSSGPFEFLTKYVLKNDNRATIISSIYSFIHGVYNEEELFDDCVYSGIINSLGYELYSKQNNKKFSCPLCSKRYTNDSIHYKKHVEKCSTLTKIEIDSLKELYITELKCEINIKIDQTLTQLIKISFGISYHMAIELSRSSKFNFIRSMMLKHILDSINIHEKML